MSFSHIRRAVFPILVLLAAAVLWALDLREKSARKPEEKPPAHAPAEAPRGPAPRKTEQSRKPAANAKTSRAGNRPAEKSGGYEIHRSCTLAEARGNDGDSFTVNLPDGRREIFRLYFVDAPESAFRRYAGGDTNAKRIRDQAADLGGITPEEAVEIGKQAKAFTLELLRSVPFTIHTAWDSPFHDSRYHAFVTVEAGGKPRLLHELLIERGLARIRTKPATLPDGTPAETQRTRLRAAEKTARQAGRGAWAL